ncbi:UNVERIFIED_CONTAM: hypothetical protein HDU68_006373 [Siphonaria sp. JEL0065]|nr:hypothetical protein HDU68_006373 [Siphonaria sp. JEL0065]
MQQDPQQLIHISPSGLLAKSRTLGRQLKSKVLNRLKSHLLESQKSGGYTRELERKLEVAQKSLTVHQERLASLQKEYDSIVATSMVAGRGEKHILFKKSGLPVAQTVTNPNLSIMQHEMIVIGWTVVFVFALVLMLSKQPNVQWILWEVSMNAHRAQASCGVF